MADPHSTLSAGTAELPVTATPPAPESAPAPEMPALKIPEPLAPVAPATNGSTHAPVKIPEPLAIPKIPEPLTIPDPIAKAPEPVAVPEPVSVPAPVAIPSPVAVPAPVVVPPPVSVTPATITAPTPQPKTAAKTPSKKPPASPTDTDGDGARMGFMDHLMELRSRMVWAVVALVVCVIVSLIFYKDIFALLRLPAETLNAEYAANVDYQKSLIERGLPEGTPVVKIISLDPLDTMMMVMWVGVWAGIVISSPIVFYELYSFVSPGLKNNEKRALRPVLFGGIFFFLAGAALAYFVLFPTSIGFFAWLNTDLNVDTSWSLEKYISLLITMMVICGLVWEVPLIVAVLAKLEVVRASMLTRFWRPCVLVSFILGSLLSPGSDVMSMLLFTAMLLSLYVLSIFMAWLFHPKVKAIK